MQRVLPEKIILNIQENSGQITIGNYVMQLGSGYGALLYLALPGATSPHSGGAYGRAESPLLASPLSSGTRPKGRKRGVSATEEGWSVRLLPFPSLFLGRLAETETALQYLQQGQAVGVYGPSGIGKTTLLAYLMHQAPAQSFTDGIV